MHCSGVTLVTMTLVSVEEEGTVKFAIDRLTV